MDTFDNPSEVFSMASLILLLLFTAHRSLQLLSDGVDEDDMDEDVSVDSQLLELQAMDMENITHAALQHWRFWNNLTMLDDDLGFWVKPRSTTWFTKFLLEEYEDDRWVQMFRMTKRAVMSLTAILAPEIRRQDTNYRLAIPVVVRLACTLFKLSHGASLLVCSELFAVGRSTVSIMLRDVVHAVNIALRSEIAWPTGERLEGVVSDFYQLSGLPGIAGAIDGTHFHISKPKFAAADYYYFKSGGYSMTCQAVVDSSKRFLDIYVGMPGSTNDSRVLRRSTLYHKAQRNVLWDPASTFNGFTPYLVGDAGFPLLPWLLVPHRERGQLPLPDALFNKKMCRARVVVENAFALLKQSFRELHCKSELSVCFLPDVVTCCALLHNLLWKQSHMDVERLLEVLRVENRPVQNALGTQATDGPIHTVEEDSAFDIGVQKRRELGLYLVTQRVVPV